MLIGSENFCQLLLHHTDIMEVVLLRGGEEEEEEEIKVKGDGWKREDKEEKVK